MGYIFLPLTPPARTKPLPPSRRAKAPATARRRRRGEGPALSHRMGYVFSVLVPYQRSAAFTPLQRWTISERLRIHAPRASADVEAVSRPRSFGKALNT